MERTGQYLFNPSNFDVRLVMGDEWVGHENDIRWLLHKIIRTGECRRHDEDEYVHISQQTMRTFMDGKVQSKLKSVLTDRAVIKVRLDRNGNEGYLDSKIARDGNGYSKAYRMTPEYDGKMVMWEITSRTLANKMIRNRFAVHDKALPTAEMMEVYKYLENWLSKLTILPEVDEAVAQMPLPAPKRKKRRKARRNGRGRKISLRRHRRQKAVRTLAAYHSKIMIAVNEIRLISSDESHRPLAEVCPHLRFHTSITHLATTCRRFLRLEGHQLVNVDIRNSQIVFFTILYMKNKLDNRDEKDVIRGPLSSYLSDQGVWVEEDLEGLARVPKGVFSKEDITFFRLVLTGDLYDWLMRQMGIKRTSDHEWENVRKGYKKTIFKDIFYGDKVVQL